MAMRNVTNTNGCSLCARGKLCMFDDDDRFGCLLEI